MKAKEEAIQLHNKFYVLGFVGLQRFTEGNVIASDAIQCALIYVNGIIEEYTHRGTSQIWEHPRLEYWNEVKLELEKL